jgi:nucleoside-diphosphate-sugar epimerase
MTSSLLILGCGYVGSALARHYQTASPTNPNPAPQTLTVTTTTAERLGELQQIADQALILDSRDVEALGDQLQQHSHLLVSVGAKRGTAYRDTYLQTAQALTQALEGNRTIGQIIYTSSYSVYGDRQGDWVSETAAIAPQGENAQILAETEAQFLALATASRRICIFRLGGIYGPGRDLGRIFSFAAGKTRPGDGSDASNWVHLEDIVGAIDFALSRNLSGIYNLVNSDPVASKTLLDWVCQQYDLAPITWDPSQTSPRAYNARVSNQKLRDAGYQFRHGSLLTE